ncbi:MAG: M28 family peptidase [Chloracidobacterium sp.]|nr:M28 family peptidase [Chloracidobacterium sp.]MCO5333160.1 M28 family peptidase [Pyrinomonadaceae bacterium]
MMNKRILSLLTAALFAAQVAFAQAPAKPIKITPAERQAVSAITAKQLSDYLYFVASDEMEGRDTPSRGLDTTAKFIGMNLSRWGFKPAGDNGTYYQKIALRYEQADPDRNSLKVGDTTYKFNTDYFKLSGNGSVSGPLVFGGEGWLVKSKGMEPYKNMDLTGKIVILMSKAPPRGAGGMALPPGVTQADLTGTKGVDWADPVTYAKSKGAKAVINIAGPQLAAFWPQIKGFFGRPRVSPEKLEKAAANPDIPALLLSHQAGEAIVGKDKLEAGNAFELDKTAAIEAESKVETKWTQNVVALWEGSDPVLKKEMVAIGAHYDHDGIRPDAPGPDKIWNGADDDGSGTVAVLSIAEALAKSSVKPKRSILFVWHCGEEKGLWGSEYFNKFPTVDIKEVVAQLNIDMIGRSKPEGDTDPKDKELSDANTIYVIGKDMMSSTLGSVVSGVNAGYLKMNYDTRYDDPKDPNRFFFRSDHFNYAQNGIPVTFWFDGIHVDYHQASDTADKIDYQKMEKVTRTIMLTLFKIADLKTRPAVDKELPAELKR